MNRNAVADIADFIIATSLEFVSDEVKDAAARVIPDTIGVMLAGTTSQFAEPLQRLVATHGNTGGPCTVGWAKEVAADIAALVNGTLGHALDFDDQIEMYPGHPSAVVMAALLATTKPEVLDGKSFLEAYIIGIEVGAKVGNAIGPGHYMRGWHSTATIGIFAAVGALAKLLTLDRVTILNAFGIAGSLASGLRCNFGTMTKPLHSGWAARCAVSAVEFASIGWTATTALFDDRFGFLEVYGDEKSSSANIGSSLGNPFVFVRPGVALKRYPCYFGVHRAIDATREVLDAFQGVSCRDIRSVVCRVAPGRLKAVLYPRPTTALEGKFSYEYVIAATLVDGSIGLRSFTDEAVQRPEIRSLIERVTVLEDPRCAGISGSVQQEALGTAGFMEVTVVTVGGDEHSAAVHHSRGSPENPLSWLEVLEKFGDCAREAGVAETAIGSAARQFRHPERIRDIRRVIRKLVVAPTNLSHS